jgi:hypothetical protein
VRPSPCVPKSSEVPAFRHQSSGSSTSKRIHSLSLCARLLDLSHFLLPETHFGTPLDALVKGDVIPRFVSKTLAALDQAAGSYPFPAPPPRPSSPRPSPSPPPPRLPDSCAVFSQDKLLEERPEAQEQVQKLKEAISASGTTPHSTFSAPFFSYWLILMRRNRGIWRQPALRDHRPP